MNLDYLLCLIRAYYGVYLLVVVLLLCVIRAVHAKLTRGDKWYLGLIPGLYYLYISGTGAVAYWYSIITMVFLYLNVWSPSIILLIIWLGLSIREYHSYCYLEFECNPWLFALVPFYKYFIMIKEVLECSRCSKAKST